MPVVWEKRGQGWVSQMEEVAMPVRVQGVGWVWETKVGVSQ